MPLPLILAGLTREPGRPRLTWYGPDERVELSGHVLDNWVTKTANFLVEEYEVRPGTRVLLDLPAHWRLVVWALAVWRAGACVLLPGSKDADLEAAALVVTDNPDSYQGVDVVAVALPALARHFAGTLPPGAVDATAAVMTYGDVLTWMPEPDPAASALPEVTHRQLSAWAKRATGGLDPAGRVLVEAAAGAGGPGDLLAVALAVLAADGSVVLCAPELVAELAAEPQAFQRLIDSELVTERVRVPRS